MPSLILRNLLLREGYNFLPILEEDKSWDCILGQYSLNNSGISNWQMSFFYLPESCTKKFF